MIIPPPHLWNETTAQRLLPCFRARLRDVQREREQRYGVTDEPDHDLQLLESRYRDAVEMLDRIVSAGIKWLLASHLAAALKQLFESAPRRAVLAECPDSEL
jgi:hypothetical protein